MNTLEFLGGQEHSFKEGEFTLGPQLRTAVFFLSTQWSPNKSF